MYITIPSFLNETELIQIKNILSQSAFHDGKITATGAAQMVKNNLQLPREDEKTFAVNAVLEKALVNNLMFREGTQAKSILPFLISKYTSDNECRACGIAGGSKHYRFFKQSL